MPEYTPGTSILEVMLNVLHGVTALDDEPVAAAPQPTVYHEAIARSRSLSNLEREQREYFAYQKSKREAPQVFAGSLGSPSGVVPTATSLKFAAGPQPGREFQTRMDSVQPAPSSAPNHPTRKHLPVTAPPPLHAASATVTTSQKPTFRVINLTRSTPQGVNLRMGG